MQGVLAGADDAGLLPGFLQADAADQAGEAAADDEGIEFHTSSTCL